MKLLEVDEMTCTNTIMADAMAARVTFVPLICTHYYPLSLDPLMDI